MTRGEAQEDARLTIALSISRIVGGLPRAGLLAFSLRRQSGKSKALELVSLL